MRIDKLHITKFKNLKDFNIDFNEEVLTNVLIGQNGFGKSNVFEALVIIFRDLDLNQAAQFSYKINYICNGIDVYIQAIERTKKYKIKINGEESSYKELIEKDQDGNPKYLPRFVFAYYSGTSERLKKLFNPHQNLFYRNMLNDQDDALRPFFYARLIHSHFVLLAFFSFQEKRLNDFLKEYLQIAELESVLFVLKKPYWDKKKKGTHTLNDFWGARGAVRGFIDQLHQLALAPISEEITVEDGFKKSKEEVSYLYIKDEDSLRALAERYINNQNFFKYLESTYLSDLILEVRIQVKKTDGTNITFNELSEGEQQLLTVFGLLKFTKDSESLFLLDEPDTHLNPKWKFDYLDLLKDVVGDSEGSQLIISTHDPLVIGGLSSEQVTIFSSKEGEVKTRNPYFDPKGMGVAGLLTSELFGLTSTLDPDTQGKIDRKRDLMYKDNKTKADENEIKRISDELGILDYTRTIRDPLYEKFAKAVTRAEAFKKPVLSKEDLIEQEKIADEILAEIIEEERS